MADDADTRSCVAEALRTLDVRNLTLCIHDASFPGDADEDIGRGAPCSRGGIRFLDFVRKLGFTGLQLGPDGLTPPDDPSPYRSSAFPKSVLSIALAPLAGDGEWGGLLPPEALEQAVAARPAGAREHADHERAALLHDRALRAAFHTRSSAQGGSFAHVAHEQQRFERENADWLERYELFEPLALANATRDVHAWGPLDARLWATDPDGEPARAARRHALRDGHAKSIAFFRFAQFLAHADRRRFSTAARAAGLRLFADLPIGLSPIDEWCHPELFLAGYRMGAPPSRTTPAGQPWGYPVFDPRRYVEPVPGGGTRAGQGAGQVIRFLDARLDRLFADVDGVRVDHPHGLVCPWVYDARRGDDACAVRDGARLFESPALPDHPELAAFAIARRDQLNPDPRTPRYADDWVVTLDAEQVERYDVLVDAIVGAARRHGHGPEDVVCEILSTLPTPLARVLASHGLGRFRVTQKAALADPHDVYRSENARPEDWGMVGTHDTQSIWSVVDAWERAGEIRARAEYLAWRLAPRPERRSTLARMLADDRGLLVHAQLADLFASPVRNVMVFFPDLFGLREAYNVPGTVGPKNWSLRVPPAYAEDYREHIRVGRALDLPRALAMALRARGVEDGDLLGGLEAAIAARNRGGFGGGG